MKTTKFYDFQSKVDSNDPLGKASIYFQTVNIDMPFAFSRDLKKSFRMSRSFSLQRKKNRLCRQHNHDGAL